MTRDAEQRLIAAVTLLVAGVATVGWFAWILAAGGPPMAVTPFVLGSVAFVVLSIAAGPIAMVARDRLDRDWAMTARHLTLLLVVGLLGETIAVLVWGPGGVVVLAATVLALVSFWAVVPLAIGAISATTGGTTMLSVVVAWPATNVLALALFAAPTPTGGIDFGRYNVLFLSEAARSIALLGLVVLVALGPTLLGKAIDRWVYR
jgi:hypothetical protein